MSARDARRKRSRSRDVKDERKGGDRTLRGRRRKRPRYWDMTPEQALQLGLPLERAQAHFAGATGGPSGRTAVADNNAYKIYCGFGSLAVTPTEEELRQFFNVTMVAAQGADRTPGDSVVGVYTNPERRYAFIQFRTPEEATQALDLDGISFRGQRLRLGAASHSGGNAPSGAVARPMNVKRLHVERLGIVSTQVPDGPHKIYIGGLPQALTDDQVKELLSTYGPLKAFFLFQDPATGLSRGFAFAEYRDHSVTQAAIRGLNGLQVGDRRITVKIHDSGLSQTQTQVGANPANVMQDLGLTVKETIAPTEVVCFLQMVTESDLIDNTEYDGILEDVREEAGKFGQVIDLVIPRPMAGRKVPGVGKVFVQMDIIENAEKVKKALEGRQFLGRTVLATFFSKEKFIARQL